MKPIKVVKNDTGQIVEATQLTRCCIADMVDWLCIDEHSEYWIIKGCGFTIFDNFEFIENYKPVSTEWHLSDAQDYIEYIINDVYLNNRTHFIIDDNGHKFAVIPYSELLADKIGNFV